MAQNPIVGTRTYCKVGDAVYVRPAPESAYARFLKAGAGAPTVAECTKIRGLHPRRNQRFQPSKNSQRPLPAITFQASQGIVGPQLVESLT